MPERGHNAGLIRRLEAKKHETTGYGSALLSYKKAALSFFVVGVLPAATTNRRRAAAAGCRRRVSTTSKA